MPLSLSRARLQGRRLRDYFARHGLRRGLPRLVHQYRAMAELRLGDYRGSDFWGNEYYEADEDSPARRRFVVYHDLKNPDATFVSSEWFNWLHQVCEETPSEWPPPRYDWEILRTPAPLAELGAVCDRGPSNWLPRLLHEEPLRPELDRQKRATYDASRARVIHRVTVDEMADIEPTPVELALIGGEEGEVELKGACHRAQGVEELYQPWHQPLPWRVPVRARIRPSDTRWRVARSTNELRMAPTAIGAVGSKG